MKGATTKANSANAAALKMHQEVEREWLIQKKAQKNNFKKLFSKMQGLPCELSK